ncbi:hypothetical protein IF1G_00965 [Cordyceps javanica]|uniref:Uncharacterized protein n=1 Tax=Cordyceps javanica TaxID=43265 RepID=A0A545VH28_9HYPO|nr:hypothetical protein IF1G_00965 [Cordyceps javanica]
MLISWLETDYQSARHVSKSSISKFGHPLRYSRVSDFATEILKPAVVHNHAHVHHVPISPSLLSSGTSRNTS